MDFDFVIIEETNMLKNASKEEINNIQKMEKKENDAAIIINDHIIL